MRQEIHDVSVTGADITTLPRPRPTHRKSCDVIVPGCQWPCVPLFEKQINVCLYERVFLFNNKLTESCSKGDCQSDPPVTNHVHGAVWRGVMGHIARSGGCWEWLEREKRSLTPVSPQTYSPSLGFNKELCLLESPGWLNSSRNALLVSLIVFINTWPFNQ